MAKPVTQKSRVRDADTYRGARRNKAKALKLSWRALRRVRNSATGQVFVQV